MDLSRRIKEVIADHFGVELEKVVDDANFETDLGADSITVTELIMAFEEEFNIEIPDEEATKLKTVADLVNYIQSKTSE